MMLPEKLINEFEKLWCSLVKRHKDTNYEFSVALGALNLENLNLLTAVKVNR